MTAARMTDADFEAAAVRLDAALGPEFWRLAGEVIAAPESADEVRKLLHELASADEADRSTTAPPTPQRVRRARKPTLGRALAQAAKAGKPVKSATLGSEGVKLEFGEPDSNQVNELDEWIAKHAYKIERH
jgi:hypothetical protein